MRSCTTFLMFETPAEQAMELYQRAFPDAVLEEVERYSAQDAGPEGSVKLATLTLAGHQLRIFHSPMHHEFGFTPAVSLFVECESEAEIEAAHAALAEGGQALMPLGEYEFAKRFVWLNDRFGVSWQLSLT